jgi:hypothetical protein
MRTFSPDQETAEIKEQGDPESPDILVSNGASFIGLNGYWDSDDPRSAAFGHFLEKPLDTGCLEPNLLPALNGIRKSSALKAP